MPRIRRPRRSPLKEAPPISQQRPARPLPWHKPSKHRTSSFTNIPKGYKYFWCIKGILVCVFFGLVRLVVKQDLSSSTRTTESFIRKKSAAQRAWMEASAVHTHHLHHPEHPEEESTNPIITDTNHNEEGDDQWPKPPQDTTTATEPPLHPPAIVHNNSVLPEKHETGDIQKKAAAAASHKEPPHEGNEEAPKEPNTLSFHTRTVTREANPPPLHAYCRHHSDGWVPPVLRPLALNRSSTLPKLGVLVDAARTYFDIPWLYQLVDVLEALQYNYLQLRLTDDQHFRLPLTNWNDTFSQEPHTYYTKQELQAWVQYATQHSVQVIPEVTLPGHAASWVFVRDAVVPCPQFTCESGFGVPLDTTQPRVLFYIQEVLQMVLELFPDAPYLHLGGDEVHLGHACWEEAGRKVPDPHLFETKLHDILKSFNVSSNGVVRWQSSHPGAQFAVPSSDRAPMSPAALRLLQETAHTNGHSLEIKDTDRTGKVVHFWSTFPDQLPREVLPKEFFVSTGLYFDTCGEATAEDLSIITRRHVQSGAVAIIAGTFELGPCEWQMRNVWGKLLAVRLGLDEPPSDASFTQYYGTACREIGLAEELCALEGKPLVESSSWSEFHQNTTREYWKNAVCDRLTTKTEGLVMRYKDPTVTSDAQDMLRAATKAASHQKMLYRQAAWKQESLPPPPNGTTHAYAHSLQHVGVMVDTAHHSFALEWFYRLIRSMQKLGLNLLHVRLLDNAFFPTLLGSFNHDAIPIGETLGRTYNESFYSNVVRYATQHGVRVMPGFNLLGHAGGLRTSGLLADCPNALCREGSVPLDIANPRLLYKLVPFLGQMQRTFYTAPYLHMGANDRAATRACLEEAYPIGNHHDDIDAFEDSLQQVMSHMNVKASGMLRWQSDDPSDVGTSSKQQQQQYVTHYREALPPAEYNETGNFMVTIGMDAVKDDNAWSIYQLARQAAAQPGNRGIIIGTLEMGPTTWDDLNIYGKLLAVSLGTSSQTQDLAQETFQEHYQSACKALGLGRKHACELEGQRRNTSSGIEWEVLKLKQESRWRSKTCKNATYTAELRLPNPSFFTPRKATKS